MRLLIVLVLFEDDSDHLFFFLTGITCFAVDALRCFIYLRYSSLLDVWIFSSNQWGLFKSHIWQKKTYLHGMAIHTYVDVLWRGRGDARTQFSEKKIELQYLVQRAWSHHKNSVVLPLSIDSPQHKWGDNILYFFPLTIFSPTQPCFLNSLL